MRIAPFAPQGIGIGAFQQFADRQRVMHGGISSLCPPDSQSKDSQGDRKHPVESSCVRRKRGDEHTMIRAAGPLTATGTPNPIRATVPHCEGAITNGNGNWGILTAELRRFEYQISPNGAIRARRTERVLVG